MRFYKSIRSLPLEGHSAVVSDTKGDNRLLPTAWEPLLPDLQLK